MVLLRMTVWYVSILTLVFSATAADDVVGLPTKRSFLENSSLEVHTAEANVVLAEKTLNSSTNACYSAADCHNGALCFIDYYGERDGNYCQCKNGTSGYLCEIIDECVRIPPKCGNASDVECVYDLVKEESNCICNNASKGFDSHLKKCRIPCESKDDCPEYSRCIKDDDNALKFCFCPWGIGGDRCTEEVDECKVRGLDCSNNPNVTCLKGQKGEAVCYCEVREWNIAYHYESKECITCDCDSLYGCQYLPGGTKECYCTSKQYQVDGKCKDCNCGSGPQGCHLENGTKVCDCWEPYIDNGGVCQKCDCGKNSSGCIFENNKKLCSCMKGTFQVDGICRQNCTGSDVECEHGGKCVNSVCQCLPGTSGDLCEVIQDCEDAFDRRLKCGNSQRVYCNFNQVSLLPYCACKDEGYAYDIINRECKYCNCGPNGNCSYFLGDRRCACKEGYKERPSRFGDSQCVRCDCGLWSKGCKFVDFETKQCDCDDGYSQKDGICSKCDCGPRGKCTFDYSGRKVCTCIDTFKEKNGICQECDCGFYGKCEFNDEGEKVCNCNEGYGDNNGECTYCSCFMKYSSVPCTFIDSVQTCLCPAGYKESSYNCIDIDECLNRSACPLNTVCQNTEGNYTCNCKNGYRPWSNQLDTKLYGCTDINECLEQNACRYRDTTQCINTQGSYLCLCKEGYYSRFSKYSIELEGCEQDQTGWRIGYIVLLVVSIITIIGLSIAIIRKRLLS